jgi:hypothetical protein
MYSDRFVAAAGCPPLEGFSVRSTRSTTMRREKADARMKHESLARGSGAWQLLAGPGLALTAKSVDSPTNAPQDPPFSN